jgi:hypothetical protein
LLNVTGLNKMQGFLVGNCSRLPCVHYSEMPSRIEKTWQAHEEKISMLANKLLLRATSLNDSGNDDKEDEEEMSKSSVVVGKENVIAKENDNLKKKIANLERQVEMLANCRAGESISLGAPIMGVRW